MQRLIAVIILTFVVVLASAAADAQPLRLGLEAGLGYEGETGRPWAIVPLIGLTVEHGNLWGVADVTSAIPDNLIDTAGLTIGWTFLDLGGASIGAESLIWWRNYGSLGDETRFGVLARLDAGSRTGEQGFFFRAEVGDSLLQTRYADGLNAETDQDPLGRLDLGWRFSGPWTADLALADFDRMDASLYLKTFFEFGAAYAVGSTTLAARLVVKYTDFFTLTAYVDGIALRFTATIPLTEWNE